MGDIVEAGFDVSGTPEVQDVLRMNREVALEVATARAERTRLAFRRSGVFERTFQRVLKETNEMAGVDVEAAWNAPEGYFDPYADLGIDRQ